MVHSIITWSVEFSRKAEKQAAKMSRSIRQALFALIYDIETRGPIRGDWPNYSKLDEGRHHCHIKKGKPTIVAIWEERDKSVKLIEVTYVGTHEKAPY
jgi:mRNA-degrading endonuclease RelE of RelBE toxin-antitoxin system